MVKTSGSDGQPLVTIPQGQLRGKIGKDYVGDKFYSFLGIPYAKAPVGELRFQAPQTAEPWQGVLDATKEGPACPSLHMLLQHYIGHEDNCLNLNVYTHQISTTSEPIPKPVMVWIHGGGFVHGSNQRDFYGPEYLMTEDIVLVVINYRLGVLGFLCLESTELNVPGNNGLKDMVMALQWVQRNIKYFGGDAKNVTIAGESAGAASVHYLLLSPMSKGLFHKAIMQSGCALNCWARGEPNGKIVAKLMGYEDDDDELAILNYLKHASTRKLVTAQHKVPEAVLPDAIRPFGPVIENAQCKGPLFLTEDPIQIMRAGQCHKVPIIMGYNSNEGILYGGALKLRPGEKYARNFEAEIPNYFALEKGSKASIAVAHNIEQFYFKDAPPSKDTIGAIYKLKTDNNFTHSIHQSVTLLEPHMPAVYMYRFCLDTKLNFWKRVCTSKIILVAVIMYLLMYRVNCRMFRQCMLWLLDKMPREDIVGACHADDIHYLFKAYMNPEVEPNTPEDAGIQSVVGMWTQFVSRSDPTPDSISPKWPPVNPKLRYFFDIGSAFKVGTYPDKSRIDFWNSLMDTAN